MNKFIFTCGDINGIGPEIVLKTINRIHQNPETRIYFACPLNVFEDAASFVKPQFSFDVIKPGKTASDKSVTIIDIGKTKIHRGEITKRSGRAAFNAIKLAFDYTIQRKADAMITAPISKTALHKAGYNFPGHTEMLAGWCRATNFVMMFLSKEMNAALVTIHEPVKKVSSLITKKYLADKIDLIIYSLQKD